MSKAKILTSFVQKFMSQVQIQSTSRDTPTFKQCGPGPETLSLTKARFLFFDTVKLFLVIKKVNCSLICVPIQQLDIIPTIRSTGDTLP